MSRWLHLSMMVLAAALLPLAMGFASLDGAASSSWTGGTVSQQITSTVASGSIAIQLANGARFDLNASSPGNYYLYNGASGPTFVGQVNVGNIASSGVYYGATSTSASVLGQVADGATAVGAKVGNAFTTLSNATAKLLQVNNNGTEKFSIDKDGSPMPAAGTLPTCGSSHVYKQVTIAGSGSALSKLCVCAFDGTTYSWVNLYNPGTRTGNTTTCPAS